MKKIIISILSLLYFTASVGYTFRNHYCTCMVADHSGDKCISKNCDKCSSENITPNFNNCCQNENNHVINNLVQNIPEEEFHIASVAAVAFPFHSFEISSGLFASSNEVNPINHPPPLNSGVSIFLLDCVFRI